MLAAGPSGATRGVMDPSAGGLIVLLGRVQQIVPCASHGGLGPLQVDAEQKQQGRSSK